MPSLSHLPVMGTSAGGMATLTRLVAQLPATRPAAVLVTKPLLSSMARPRAQQQAERVEDMKHHINRLREFLLHGSTGSTRPAEGKGLAQWPGQLSWAGGPAAC